MPELPEVETVVRSLAPYLPGRTIDRAEFRSKFVTPGNRATLASRLTKRKIESISRRGKFIWIRLDSGSLAIHLGMTGRLLFNGADGPHTHGLFQLDSDTLLVYDDPRQFGRIEWSEGREIPLRIAALGPEPLEISAPEFIARLKSRTTKIKPLLLDQSFLAGLGNIYVDEALFRASIHPHTQAKKISKAKAHLLHQSIVETLRVAIEHRGSSISDYVDADGQRGKFQNLHQAYGREGKPCPRCNAPIRKIVVAQRGTHFCPRCQR
ncbi:MAG TPA: bifunctional DNA-formamidopyrimidine glycosylase/DNA-(apurinic or apyrimidinic site) lyase [Bryobacteraceae bacterium]|jgi:formamidopyrimidine-DNA glycosylase